MIAPPPAVEPAVERLLLEARAAGRSHLLETEGLAVARSLGLAVPRHRVVAGAAEAGRADLGAFPGDRLVVKVLSPAILHKTEAGGVAVVPRRPEAAAEAVRAMERRFAGEPVAGYGLFEFVPHEASFGGELLLGMRWTEELGAVVTLAPGGILAEPLAGWLRPERAGAILSPAFSSPGEIDRVLAGKAVVEALTAGLRGKPPRLAPERLREVVGNFLRFAAAAVPRLLTEFEVNPAVPVGGGLTALDALARLGTGEPPRVERPRPLGKVAKLLAPRSVAVAGVSGSGMNPGRVILRNLLEEGFDPADLHVVKPRAEEIDGVRCRPDVASLPGRVDLLVLAVEAARVPGLVEEAVAGEKAESLLLIPGGLGETRGSGGHVERIRAALARSRETPWGGPVANGGNCLGLRSVPGRVNTLFIPGAKLRFPAGVESPLAILSQSGAFAIARASHLDALNPRYLVTFGNQIDLTAADWLEHLAGDPAVEVFAVYVEGFRPLDGLRFFETAAKIAAGGRTVVLYRAGRTAAGAGAAASHTASVAGDDAATCELARAAGVLLADSLEDFEDLASLASALRGRKARGNALGAVSNAGFECVAMADRLGPFRLAAFSPEARERIARLFEERRLGSVVEVHNPLDVTPIFDDEAFAEAARAVLEDPAVDVGIVGCVPLSGRLQTLPEGEAHGEDALRPGAVADRLARLFAETAKPWVVVVDAGALYDPLARRLAERGLPVFRAADRALGALGAWWRAGYSPG